MISDDWYLMGLDVVPGEPAVDLNLLLFIAYRMIIRYLVQLTFERTDQNMEVLYFLCLCPCLSFVGGWKLLFGTTREGEIDLSIVGFASTQLCTTNFCLAQRYLPCLC